MKPIFISLLILFVSYNNTYSQSDLISFEYPNHVIHQSYFPDSIIPQLRNDYSFKENNLIIPYSELEYIKWYMPSEKQGIIFKDILGQLVIKISTKDELFYSYVTLVYLESNFHNWKSIPQSERDRLDSLVFLCYEQIFIHEPFLTQDAIEIMNNIGRVNLFTENLNDLPITLEYPELIFEFLKSYFLAKSNEPDAMEKYDTVSLKGKVRYYSNKNNLSQEIIDKSVHDTSVKLINEIITQFHNDELDYFKNSTYEN